MAVDHARAKSTSYQAAFTYLYAHPDNVALREQVKAEYMQHALSGVGANSGSPAQTLTIDQAQNLEPVKDFTGTGNYSRDIARKSQAESELESLARQHHAANPDKSYERSYAKILLENLVIAKAARQERLSKLGIG